MRCLHCTGGCLTFQAKRVMWNINNLHAPAQPVLGIIHSADRGRSFGHDGSCGYKQRTSKREQQSIRGSSRSNCSVETVVK
ncbi:hypothetical protein DPMN_031165 [Dreissena polymorpha]|uniref:Uncharacterized protein n=1 Tax=Dreissena polymorpha TaxID=45954 RepID=A0A9D4M0F6_DREPO|nr:hypothetical protein DPMN_031165 [Dreissena polymorpha]